MNKNKNMNKNVINKDDNGNLHGEQIRYWPNGNIFCIDNWYHGKAHGYEVSFNLDNSIAYKCYWNMGNRIYEEHHGWYKQIEITI